MKNHLDYNNIFINNVENQILVMRIFQERLNIRKSFLPSDSPSVRRAPVDPSRGGVKGKRSTQPRLGIREASKQKRKHKQFINKTSDIKS